MDINSLKNIKERAEKLLKQDQYLNALSILKKAAKEIDKNEKLKSTKDAIDLLTLLYDAYMAFGDSKHAMKFLQKAWEYDQTNTHILERLLQNFVDKKQYSELTSTIYNLIKNNLNNYPVVYHLLNFYISKVVISKKCPNCKKENKANAKFCIYCGTNLKNVKVQFNSQFKEKAEQLITYALQYYKKEGKTQEIKNLETILNNLNPEALQTLKQKSEFNSTQKRKPKVIKIETQSSQENVKEQIIKPENKEEVKYVYGGYTKETEKPAEKKEEITYAYESYNPETKKDKLKNLQTKSTFFQDKSVEIDLKNQPDIIQDTEIIKDKGKSLIHEKNLITDNESLIKESKYDLSDILKDEDKEIDKNFKYEDFSNIILQTDKRFDLMLDSLSDTEVFKWMTKRDALFDKLIKENDDYLNNESNIILDNIFKIEKEIEEGTKKAFKY